VCHEQAASHGSLRAGGRRRQLHARGRDAADLPKATVSTLVQSLEAALSAKLLHRTTRQVTVTTDGAAYYERCVRILSDVRDAEESLSRTRCRRADACAWMRRPGCRARSWCPPCPLLRALSRHHAGTGQHRPPGRPGRGRRRLRGARRRACIDTSLIARRVGVVNFLTAASPGLPGALRHAAASARTRAPPLRELFLGQDRQDLRLGFQPRRRAHRGADARA
jgi:DNA-binding transcriptional LysR family regulator